MYTAGQFTMTRVAVTSVSPLTNENRTTIGTSHEPKPYTVMEAWAAPTKFVK